MEHYLVHGEDLAMPVVTCSHSRTRRWELQPTSSCCVSVRSGTVPQEPQSIPSGTDVEKIRTVLAPAGMHQVTFAKAHRALTDVALVIRTRTADDGKPARRSPPRPVSQRQSLVVR